MSSSETAAPWSHNVSGAETLLQHYRRIRGFSESIVEPLEPEDCVIQSMPDVSPTRWHLAHTTWFFETFFLKKRDGYQTYDDRYEYLFNSYYNTVGEQFPRDRRGLLSRPTVSEVLEYRKHVDHAVLDALKSNRIDQDEASVLEIGLHHEQQHQELMLTDIKHVLSCNPIDPAYTSFPIPSPAAPGKMGFVGYEGGVREIGHVGSTFAYDNESPRHQVLVQPFELANRLVSAGEFLEFVVEGGYQDPRWWLSLGWHVVNENRWQAPLYWRERDGEWCHFTLAGLQPIDLNAPVCHLSYFEADAYARWAEMRLPSEAEWEIASTELEISAQFADELMGSSQTVHPGSRDASSEDPKTSRDSALRQMFGQVWQWTSSPYTPYPGYQPADGALGEYNGKFMCGQYVLRGGSCATPGRHLRRTYRNFFPPDARWQFSGLRLARSA